MHLNRDLLFSSPPFSVPGRIDNIAKSIELSGDKTALSLDRFPERPAPIAKRLRGGQPGEHLKKVNGTRVGCVSFC